MYIRGWACAMLCPHFLGFETRLQYSKFLLGIIPSHVFLLPINQENEKKTGSSPKTVLTAMVTGSNKEPLPYGARRLFFVGILSWICLTGSLISGNNAVYQYGGWVCSESPLKPVGHSHMFTNRAFFKSEHLKCPRETVFFLAGCSPESSPTGL